MAKSSKITKRKTRISGSTSSGSDIRSPEGKKICDTSFSDSDTNYTFLEANEKIVSQLQEILNTLTSVEARLQKIEGLCEKISNLEKIVSKTLVKLNVHHEKGVVIDKKVGEVKKGMEFANAEIEE